MEKAAIYLRLSRDDGRLNESESISGQRLFLQKFCFENGFDIVQEYVDDGYSGTNFERPSFLKMISDAKSGSFFTVITKDLSRLGRDYIATGQYVERFFPENGIRYIAVNDSIDTRTESAGNEMIAFRAVFNDMYAKDISKKVKCALDARRAAGKFVGSSPPYGYKRDEDDKSHLVPDEKTSLVVKRIYAEFADGKSMLSIAKGLSLDGIRTPSAHKNVAYHKSTVWNSVMIKRILSNPTYAGHLTQGFVKKAGYKSKKRLRVEKEKRFVCKNTHKELVDNELFERVQERLCRYKSL